MLQVRENEISLRSCAPKKEYWLQKMRFFDSNASSLPTVLFTQYKSTWLTGISSHCKTALPTKVSVFSSYMRQNAYCGNLKCTFVAMSLLRNKGQ